MPSKIRNLTKKSALALIYKFPPLPVQINGKLLWIHPRARFSISTRTFFEGEPHVRRWVTENIKPGSVFFDIGAHHGWVSMWALTLLGEKGSVYSFEPSPANRFVLEWHRKKNGFSNWTIVPKAVCDKNENSRQFFLIDSGDSPMNSLTTGIPGTDLMQGRMINEVSIETISLDSLYTETDVEPDLIKIDVEGAELLVLEGAKSLIGKTSPKIILAVHPNWLPDGQSLQQIFDWFREFNYSILDSNNHRVSSLYKGEFLCSPK